MRAGKLRHIATIQELPLGEAADDTFGQSGAEWRDVIARAWVGIEPLSGTELFRAQQVNPEITTRIRMRYRTGIRPDMRVVYRSKAYEVLAVIDVEARGRELELLAKVNPASPDVSTTGALSTEGPAFGIGMEGGGEILLDNGDPTSLTFGTEGGEVIALETGDGELLLEQ
jgi:SPP1 family predicted phage head-tail adaptor